MSNSSDAPPSWAPRWYLWDGGFLALGRSSGIIPPHAHHAIQITIAVDGYARVREPEGDWREFRGAIVRPDVEHSFDGNSALGAMLFVDPESAEGIWLRSSVASDITVVPEPRLESCIEGIRAFAERPFEAMEVSVLIRHCVQELCVGAPPLRRLDPRIAGVLASIRAADDLRIPLEDAAALVFLSPSRFAHLFAEQVGLPFRRYMLWRKLTRALLGIGRGHGLSAAAYAGGFADAAHLARTCNRMFGVPPSALMRGEFFEIPPPFEVASPVDVAAEGRPRYPRFATGSAP
jgi:AraC family transcriptional regulator